MKSFKNTRPAPAPNTGRAPGHAFPRFLVVLLILAMLLTTSGCQNRKEDSDGKTVIRLTYFYNPDGPESLSLRLFQQRKEEWLQAHPDVSIQETVLRASDYDTEISYYASQNALPDVFLLNPNSTELWSSYDLLADTTDYIGIERLSDSDIAPFLVDGRAYTFPMLTRALLLIAYDREIWTQIGADEFPTTWEALAEANLVLKELGYTSAMAFPTLSGANISNYLLTRIFAENCGEDWLTEVLADTPSPVFINDSVYTAIHELENILESGILTGSADPIQSYLSGQCPAVIFNADQLPRLMENEETESRTEFALLPTSVESAYHSNYENSYCEGIGYALAVSSQVEEDSEKLRLCMDLCEFISCGDRTDAMLSDAQAASLLFSDLISDDAVCLDNLYCYPEFRSISEVIITIIDSLGEYTAEELANSMQNAYEAAR